MKKSETTAYLIAGVLATSVLMTGCGGGSGGGMGGLGASGLLELQELRVYLVEV